MGMSLQSSYSETPAVAFPGQLLAGPSLKEVAKNGEPTASIPFATPVAYKPAGATSDMDVTIPANATDRLKGIAFRSDGFERAWTDNAGTQGALDANGILPGILFDLARQGEMFVLCHTGCAPGDRLFVSFS